MCLCVSEVEADVIGERRPKIPCWGSVMPGTAISTALNSFKWVKALWNCISL
jgi:hypothetical protein